MQIAPKYRTCILPRKTRQCKQKTLVLDLDETLVHSSLEAVQLFDFTFPVHFNGAEHIIHVRQRPGLHAFLERVSELFEVVVFTASQKVYAERLLNIIDPHRKYIKHRIFRESCVVVDGNYLKDLSVLGRDLRHTAIVDNSPQAFGFQVGGGAEARVQRGGCAVRVGSGQPFCRCSSCCPAAYAGFCPLLTPTTSARQHNWLQLAALPPPSPPLTPCAPCAQVDNGIPIESWYEDPQDTELARLLPFLEGLVGVEDVRPAISAKFRMRELIEQAAAVHSR